MSHTSFIARAATGLGSAVVALTLAASPALAAQGHATSTPKVPASLMQRAASLPAFPGANATDAQIEAWMTSSLKALGLPAFPGVDATDRQVYTWLTQVTRTLGLPKPPAFDATDAQIDAWVAKLAAQFGLPKPPSVTHGTEAQWEAWFEKLMNMAPSGTGVSHTTSTKPATPGKTTGPIVQTDLAQPTHTGLGAAEGACAAAILGAGALLVLRRRSTRG